MGEIIDRVPNIVCKACPVCGKNFIPTYGWAYKLNGKYYCRYNCYNKAGGDKHKKYRTNGKGWR